MPEPQVGQTWLDRERNRKCRVLAVMGQKLLVKVHTIDFSQVEVPKGKIDIFPTNYVELGMNYFRSRYVRA